MSIRLAAKLRDANRLKPGSVLVRSGEEAPRPLTDADLRPGDQLVIDDTTELFTAGVVDLDGKDRVEDVLDALADPKPGDVVLRIERDTAANHRLLDAVAEATDDDSAEPEPLEITWLLRVHRGSWRRNRWWWRRPACWTGRPTSRPGPR